MRVILVLLLRGADLRVLMGQVRKGIPSVQNCEVVEINDLLKVCPELVYVDYLDHVVVVDHLRLHVLQNFP